MTNRESIKGHEIAEQFFRQGSARLRIRRWAGAAEALELAVSEDDTHAEWHHRLATAYQKLERWIDARESMERAVERDGNASHGWYRLDYRHRLAFLCRLCRQQDRAAQVYREAAQVDHSLAWWWETHESSRNDENDRQLLIDLWSLIDRDGNIETESQALALLGQAASSPHLYPDKWWFVAYTSLFKRGWCKSAYRAKAIAARVSRESSATNNEPTISQLLHVSTSFADIGDFQTSADLATEASTQAASDSNDQFLAQELAAGFHALNGQDEAADRLWRDNDAKHPRPELEQQFYDLIRNRRVAVVAPAAPIEQQGDEIDSFDLIVRTNFRRHAIIRQHHDAIGSRTDISYYNGNFEPDHRDTILEEIASIPLQFVVLRFNDPVLAKYRELVPTRVSHVINPLYRMNTYAIPKIVYDLLRFRPKCIKVFNADFFLGPSSHYDGYLDYKVDLIPSFFGHDILRNFLLMQRWREMGVVEADERLTSVLCMNAEQVIEHVAEKTQSIVAARASQ